MQPLINLKQFLAVLALLIIPAALLTAYFRNYQPGNGGGAHGHHAMGGQSAPMADHDAGHAPQPPADGRMDHSKMSNAAGGGQAPTGGDAKQAPAGGQMDHSKMTGAAGGQAPPAEPTQAQVEASRMQLEASRAQLEASRKLLEATPEAGQAAPAQPPGATSPKAAPAPSGTQPPAKAADGHAHKH